MVVFRTHRESKCAIYAICDMSPLMVVGKNDHREHTCQPELEIRKSQPVDVKHSVQMVDFVLEDDSGEPLDRVSHHCDPFLPLPRT